MNNISSQKTNPPSTQRNSPNTRTCNSKEQKETCKIASGAVGLISSVGLSISFPTSWPVTIPVSLASAFILGDGFYSLRNAPSIAENFGAILGETPIDFEKIDLVFLDLYAINSTSTPDEKTSVLDTLINNGIQNDTLSENDRVLLLIRLSFFLFAPDRSNGYTALNQLLSYSQDNSSFLSEPAKQILQKIQSDEKLNQIAIQDTKSTYIDYKNQEQISSQLNPDHKMTTTPRLEQTHNKNNLLSYQNSDSDSIGSHSELIPIREEEIYKALFEIAIRLIDISSNSQKKEAVINHLRSELNKLN